jgi:hypothetical protein
MVEDPQEKEKTIKWPSLLSIWSRLHLMIVQINGFCLEREDFKRIGTYPIHDFDSSSNLKFRRIFT